MKDRRRIIANPDEPRAGDHGYQLYNKAHPISGNQDTISDMKKQLRGLRGKTVRVTINGAHIDPDTLQPRRFTASRVIDYNMYSDMFGPGSAYASALHDVKERYSNDVLVTYSIDIEEI